MKFFTHLYSEGSEHLRGQFFLSNFNGITISKISPIITIRVPKPVSIFLRFSESFNAIKKSETIRAPPNGPVSSAFQNYGFENLSLRHPRSKNKFKNKYNFKNIFKNFKDYSPIKISKIPQIIQIRVPKIHHHPCSKKTKSVTRTSHF